MKFNRIFRIVLCVLLVVCVLFHSGPLKANAFAISGTVTMGIIAALIALSVGVVYPLQTADEYIALGNSMSSAVTSWGETNNKSDVVSSWLDSLYLGDRFTPEGAALGTFLSFSEDISSALLSWVCGLIPSSSIPVQASSLYNFEGHILPALPEWDKTAYPYAVLYQGVDSYRLLVLSHPMSSKSSSGKTCLYVSSSSCYGMEAKLMFSDVAWGAFPDRFRYGTSTFTGIHSSNILWISHNVSSLQSTYEPSLYTYEMSTDVLVSDFATGVKEGTLNQEEIQAARIPNIGYEWINPENSLADDNEKDQARIGALNAVITMLSNGEMSHADFLEKIEVESVVDPEPDATEPEETEPIVPYPPVITGTFADTAVGTFLSALVDAITAPFEWLGNFILDGIKAIFVPDQDYLTGKVDIIKSKFVFAESVIDSARSISAAFTDFYTSPPVIYAELSEYTGKYDYGDRAVVLDLTWYERYKPTVDALLSAFLWGVFIWRIYVKLPSIISGIGGDFVMLSTRDGSSGADSRKRGRK